MKKSLLKLTITILFVMFFFSCEKQANCNLGIIPVNVDLAKSLDISRGKIIELETTDESLLYEIAQIEFINEKMIILSREIVHVFDKNGKFLFNVGSKGNGPGEYVNLTNLFVQNGCIYLLDHISKKILCFDENGKFLSSISLNQNTHYPISFIYPLKNGMFIGKNMFQGDHNRVPIASLLNENFQFTETVNGKDILSGFSIKDNFFQYKERILYWEMLNDTIYSIVNNTITPLYLVDFGNQAIPEYERKDKDIYDLIEFSNKPENMNKIATGIGYINEDELYLRFRFFHKQHMHYALYNKINQGIFIYRIEDRNQEFYTESYACYQNDGCLYISVMSQKDLEKNPYLVVFDDTIFIEDLEVQ